MLHQAIPVHNVEHLHSCNAKPNLKAMKYSVLKIANRILDQIAILLIEVDEVDPQCISRLSLETDLKDCMDLSSIQLRLFKYALKLNFNLPFERLDIHRSQLPMKELITYIIVNSDDNMLYEWHGSQRVAS